MTARVVTEQQFVRLAAQKGLDRLERDMMSFHPRRVRGIGQDVPLQVEQIDLDARIDHHVLVKGLLERGLVDAALFDEIAIRHEILREVVIELLIDALHVMARRGDAEQGV